MVAATFKAAIEAAARPYAMAGIYPYAVWPASLYRPMSHIWCTITWTMPHATIEAPQYALPGVRAEICEAPPDTVLAIPVGSVSPAEIEEAVLHVAWETGAWEARRIESGPRPIGWRGSHWGPSAFQAAGVSHFGRLDAEGVEAADWMREQSARDGYLEWLFVPVAMNHSSLYRQRHLQKDASLRADCTRQPRAGTRMFDFVRPRGDIGAEHIYQFGRKARKER